MISTPGERTVQPSLDIRRHNDGSIDFDFYRRRAWRRRRLARRIIVKRCLTAIGQAAKLSLSAMARVYGALPVVASRHIFAARWMAARIRT